MFIYLDESGDLGFDFSKKKTTRKFVMTLLVCYTDEARKDISRAVKRTLKNKLNSKKTKTRAINELKGTDTTQQVKEYFFKNIKSKEWAIYALVLNKRRVTADLRTKSAKKKLYNFLSRLILERLPLSRTSGNVELVVDRCKSIEEIWDFNNYIVNQLQARLPLKTSFDISHLTSLERPELQAVDLFCWGVFRKYELRDDQWYVVFSKKLRYETEYLRG